MPDASDAHDEDGPPSSPRGRLLDAALEEIADSGLGNLTLKSVSLRAGCAHSLIAHHFGSKEGLLEACAERWTREISTRTADVVEALESNQDPISGAEAALSMAFDVAREHQSLMRVFLRSVVYREGLTDQVLDTTEPILEAFAAFLSRRFQLDETRCRAIIHQTGILVARLAIAADSELARIYSNAESDVWVSARDEAVASVIALLRARRD